MRLIFAVDDVEIDVHEMSVKEYEETIHLATGDLVTCFSEGIRNECLNVVCVKPGDLRNKEMAIFDYRVWFDLSRRSRDDLEAAYYNVQMVIEGYTPRKNSKGYVAVTLKLSQDDFSGKPKNPS